MKSRVDAGTDSAMIGAWDASRNEPPFSAIPYKEVMRHLHEDARVGDLFLVHTGADGGGPIDVYVDERAPESALKQTTDEGEFLIRVPSGRLVVDGVEYYRSSKRRITGAGVISVPTGEYGLRCHVPTEPVPFGTPSKADLQTALGMADYRYWNHREWTGCAGYLLLLLFPLLAFPLGWKVALSVSLPLVVSWFYGREAILKRNGRYQRINKAVNELYKEAAAKAPPTFIFELRRLESGTGLKGGEVMLSSRPGRTPSAG